MINVPLHTLWPVTNADQIKLLETFKEIAEVTKDLPLEVRDQNTLLRNLYLLRDFFIGVSVKAELFEKFNQN